MAGQPGGNAAPSDRAVLGLCDVLGLMFALPFGEDLYHDSPIPVAHVIYLLVGLMFAGVGHLWPRIKGVVPQQIADTVGRAALDFRLWVAALLIVFVVSIGPEVYLRAVGPGPSQPPAPSWSLVIGIAVVIIAVVILWGAIQRNIVLANRISKAELELAQNTDAIEQIRADVVTKTDRIEARAERDRKRVDDNYDFLIKALHIRDAEVIIKEMDKLVLSTRKALLEKLYPDEVAWADDYAVWEQAISRIDRILMSLSDEYRPFLDISMKDLEQTPGPP
jgi:hypothetical protein